MRQAVITGPFSLFFTNVNTDMGLGGHSHFAEVTLRWATIGESGFPAFEDTYKIISNCLLEQTATPFRGCTNEDVSRKLFAAVAAIPFNELEQFKKWPMCRFKLLSLELAVRGVPDKFHHADSFTRYVVEE